MSTCPDELAATVSVGLGLVDLLERLHRPSDQGTDRQQWAEEQQRKTDRGSVEDDPVSDERKAGRHQEWEVGRRGQMDLVLGVSPLVVQGFDQLVGVIAPDGTPFLVFGVLAVPEVIEALDHRRLGVVVGRCRVGDRPLDGSGVPWVEA